MLPSNIKTGWRGWWRRWRGEEETQHHMKAAEGKKVTLFENWNCMCEFNCAILLLYLFPSWFAALSLLLLANESCFFSSSSLKKNPKPRASPTSMNNWPRCHCTHCVSEALEGYFITTWWGVTASAGGTCVVWERHSGETQHTAPVLKKRVWDRCQPQTLSKVHFE